MCPIYPELAYAIIHLLSCNPELGNHPYPKQSRSHVADHFNIWSNHLRIAHFTLLLQITAWPHATTSHSYALLTQLFTLSDRSQLFVWLSAGKSMQLSEDEFNHWWSHTTSSTGLQVALPTVLMICKFRCITNGCCCVCPELFHSYCATEHPHSRAQITPCLRGWQGSVFLSPLVI